MAVDLFIDPATIQIPHISPQRDFKWGHLQASIATSIAHEEQYLYFHLELLNRIYFTEVGKAAERPWRKPIGLTIRAGAIKAAVLIAASIAEAVLRANAEARGYPLPAQPHRRTMGKVLSAWQLENEQPRPEIADIWGELQMLHEIRNNIHLFRMAENPDYSFQTLLNQEENLVARLPRIIDFLAKL